MKIFFIDIVSLIRADRPIGTVLLACPMLWALWLASDGHPTANIVLIFLLGAFIMRSAGCVINDFADRKIDYLVKRTQDRPLTTGRLSITVALGVFSALIVSAIVLLYFLPLRAIIPAIFAFVLAILYPFTKRFFIIPQFILGLAYASSIMMAYVVIVGHLPFSSWCLFFASAVWTVVYDTFYAMVDRDDDKQIGIHSSALLFAHHDLIICVVLVVIFLFLMVIVGVLNHLGVYYYLGLLLSIGCFLYQFIIIRKRDRQACLKAFLNNQWVGVLIFLGILLSFL
ncbi:MAG: 4-hydroxybenzoate octaprenyltransferase [Ostreibacterium sp.]